ncbi:PREDICTED: uncharacterized protein LOC107329699 [Acropora digitifera]|uniref:uncharacterized protein LOC107329699 n=1 Tax=Acropora digitifera TaxID=70779 RepID=UPI00077ABD7C|nr:PREDICTED: uncharacterized protein LOC107329699 [Acropora digitifera]
MALSYVDSVFVTKDGLVENVSVRKNRKLNPTNVSGTTPLRPKSVVETEHVCVEIVYAKRTTFFLEKSSMVNFANAATWTVPGIVTQASYVAVPSAVNAYAATAIVPVTGPANRAAAQRELTAASKTGFCVMALARANVVIVFAMPQHPTEESTVMNARLVSQH